MSVAAALVTCLCLVLALTPEISANGADSGGAGRVGQLASRALRAADALAAADTAPDSSCSGASVDFEGTKPIPCTPQQEQDALDDLAADTPSPSPSPASDGAPLSPPLDALSASECNASNPDGYTVPVDLMDPDLIDVAAAVADAFVASEGNASYWQVRSVHPATTTRCTHSGECWWEDVNDSRHDVAISRAMSA